jgi:polyphosphate kinase
MIGPVGFLPTLPSLLAEPNVPLIHRDLSWLQFNERVLAEARLATNPLLERAKFLAITATNLDEFFMIRMASLGRSISALGRTDPNGARRLMRIRSSIFETVAKFGGKQAEALDQLVAELDAAGIFLVRHAREGEPAWTLGKRAFEEQVLPRLQAPEAFSPSKVQGLDNGAMAAVFPSGIWLRIPRGIPSVLHVRDPEVSPQAHFFFLDDLLSAHLGPAFRLEGAPALIRLTRDGELAIELEEQDTESIPDAVRTGLGSRERGRPVRLQYGGESTEALLRQCVSALRLIPAQLMPAPGTLCLAGLWSLVSQAPAEEPASGPRLRHPAPAPYVPNPLRDPSRVFERIAERDLLLHHPYDSFDAFVAWVQAACADPDVTSIEQTVYRMDAVSPVIAALKGAAARKRVRVLIELRARFDEMNNLRLADELRKAGVEVAFGFGKLKLHAKVALVARREGEGERLYTHLSTGNYNAATARQYTDLAILTANPEIGADARHLFDSVFKREVPTQFKHLVPAPGRLHRRLLSHIQAETEAATQGRKARIFAKVNALVDETVIAQLYRASMAGVQVDLVVRGACSLVPGVRGLSQNIRVYSIVDRYLEHSRIYAFGHSRVLYLSSADWMPRNFFSRLEVAFPVLDPRLHKYIDEVVIPAYLSDTQKAHELTPLGTWKKRAGSRGSRGSSIRSQFHFEELAGRGYQGTPLVEG